MGGSRVMFIYYGIIIFCSIKVEKAWSNYIPNMVVRLIKLCLGKRTHLSSVVLLPALGASVGSLPLLHLHLVLLV